MSFFNFPVVAVPGQPLASSAVYQPGTGVHIFNYIIYASIVGEPQVTTSSSGSKQTLSVISNEAVPCWKKSGGNSLPRLGDIVLARVKRIHQYDATVGIFVVGEMTCADEFQGIIRQEDVRASEKDKVKIVSSFRPGDIIRARVISLGDQSKYYLSTANNSLGVIAAYSDSGEPLRVLSWREMISQNTGVIEERKVARPI